MNMEDNAMQLNIRRKPTDRDSTFGQLFIDGLFECYTLEDAVREVAGEPVDLWKIKDSTAIPSGLYRITMELSKRFGPDTITINEVPGFTKIRMHSGISAASTEGCPCVGDEIHPLNMTISGGLAHGVLKRLKAKVKAALTAGKEVWLQIDNAA